jgi:hypothetical protein
MVLQHIKIFVSRCTHVKFCSITKKTKISRGPDPPLLVAPTAVPRLAARRRRYHESVHTTLGTRVVRSRQQWHGWSSGGDTRHQSGKFGSVGKHKPISWSTHTQCLTQCTRESSGCKSVSRGDAAWPRAWGIGRDGAPRPLNSHARRPGAHVL